MRPYISFAHKVWKGLLSPTDNAIDATCGNGYDTLFLASLLNEGVTFSFDIQKIALENTQALLKDHLSKESLKRVRLIHSSHEEFSSIQGWPIKLIVYNLGYLPKGDKTITTLEKTTLLSIQNGLSLLDTKGMISITCYPHEEGIKEEESICKFLRTLQADAYSYTIHTWRGSAPKLILILKNL